MEDVRPWMYSVLGFCRMIPSPESSMMSFVTSAMNFFEEQSILGEGICYKSKKKKKKKKHDIKGVFRDFSRFGA
jgi:hypothetical protein